MSTTLGHRISRLKGDRAIWVIFLIFAMISLAVVYSASSALAFRGDTTPFRIMIRQAGYFFLGFLTVLACYLIPLRYYRWGSYILMGASILLLAVPLLTGGLRTIEIAGVSIQPSEVAKIAVVLYLARTIEVSKFNTFKEYALKILAPLGVVCVLCLMGSVSATLIICFISFIILICSKVPKKYILWTVPIAIGAIGTVFTIHALTGAFSRIDTFTARVERHFSNNEEEMSAAELKEMEDKQFQEEQAREAIQLGGITGSGPGNSLKRDILPNAYDDYIYSIIIEEYGLIGGAFVILLYLWFFYRCLKIASSCSKDFSLITVLGLSTLIMLQAFLHIFVNIGIIPVTGQTLPMISRGGSSLVIMSSAFGIILSVNRTIVIKDMKLKAQKEAQSCSALSIAGALRKMEPGTEILFVGAEGKMEMERVPAAGYNIVGLPVAGLQRRLTVSNLSIPFKVLKSLIKAGRILKEFRPDAVVGVGGYASAPMLWKAENMGIPVLVQEQNSYAGLTNRIVGKRAGKICVAYEDMERFFPADRIILTGNPIRSDIHPYTAEDRKEGLELYGLDPEYPTVLVIGGSGGCGTFNSVLSDICRKSGCALPFQVIWQSGKGYASSVSGLFGSLEGSVVKDGIRSCGNVRNCDFISRMDLAFAAADLVVSRAGAGTISELCAIGKAAIFVPSPNVTEDHQTHNAMALVEKDAAALVCDDRAAADLLPTILELLGNKERIRTLERNILKMARPDAADIIAGEVLRLINDRKR